MITSIKYGDFYFADGSNFLREDLTIAKRSWPTPFIQRSESSILNGEKWGTQETFTLRGVITGCDFEQIRNRQKLLISGFGKDFQSLEIIQSPQGIFEGLFVENAGDFDANGAYLTTNFLFNNFPTYIKTGENTISSNLIQTSHSIFANIFPISPFDWMWTMSSGDSQLYRSEDVWDFNIQENAPFYPDETNWITSGSYSGNLPPPSVRKLSPNDYGTTLFEKPNIKVESINFPESRYVGAIEYEIELSHFPEDYFTEFYGVIDPIDSWEFIENDDQQLDINHTVSCKGFNTSSFANNALQNAKNFVFSRTGTSNMIVPHFICKQTFPNFYPCLDSFSEKIDRIQGSYEVTENYISDINGTGYGVLKYSSSVSSGINDFAQVSIDGEVWGCKNKGFQFTREKYKSFNVVNAAIEAYQDSLGQNDLSLIPLVSGVQEDPINKKITFNITFNNDRSPKTSFDVTTSVSSGDSIISVDVNGNIVGKGDIKSRYENIESAYSQFNIFGAAQNAYVNFLDGNVIFPLNPQFESSGVTKDKFTPSISFSASFNNKEIPPSGFNSFEKTISFTPSMRQLKAIPLFDRDGDYDIIDLLFDTRASIAINIDAEANQDINSYQASQTLKDAGDFMLQKYGRLEKLKLEDYSITSGNLNKYSLNATWTFETPHKLISPPNYSGINTFRVK